MLNKLIFQVNASLQDILLFVLCFGLSLYLYPEHKLNDLEDHNISYRKAHKITFATLYYSFYQLRYINYLFGLG